MSIANRIAIASRVVQRFRTAETMGDPKALLAAFEHDLTDFAKHEDAAKKLSAIYAELLPLKANPTWNGPDEYQTYVVKVKALRDTIDPIASNAIERGETRYGYRRLHQNAQALTWAIVQQLVLPPKLRKAVEAAAKFWYKEKAWRPKARSSFIEEYNAECVAKYLDDLSLYRKHQAIFEACVAQGTAHTEGGEGNSGTRIKAGSFTLVNTGGFKPEVMERARQVVEEAEHKMRAIGLGNVCYGDILVSNRLTGKTTVAAFYVIASDEMFVRADAKAHPDTIRIVCHELTHRYEHKFMGAKRIGMARIYGTIEAHSRFGTIDPEDAPKPGEDFVVKGVTYKVKKVNMYAKKFELEDPARPGQTFTAPIALYAQERNIAPRGLNFVTPYAKKGGPGENFAEMVSFYALGKLPSEQVELLKPLL